MPGVRGLLRFAGASCSGLYECAARRAELESAVVDHLKRCITSSSAAWQQQGPPIDASRPGLAASAPTRKAKGRMIQLDISARLAEYKKQRSDQPHADEPVPSQELQQPVPAPATAEANSMPQPQPQQEQAHPQQPQQPQQTQQPHQEQARPAQQPSQAPQGPPQPPASVLAATPATASAASSLPPGAAREQVLSSLSQALLQPISISKKYNGQLSPYMVNLGGHLYLDPERTLASTMRALHVIKQVLKEDGHIYVVNSNPDMRPLMREASACSTNSNVWFFSEAWAPGTLTNRDTDRLFKAQHQPTRALLASKGLRIHNVHCEENVHSMPLLSWRDKWAMYGRRSWNSQGGGSGGGGSRPSGTDFLAALNDVMDAEVEVTDRFQDPRQLQGAERVLRLLLVLDSSVNRTALLEAQKTNIMTAALVNHHSDLSAITYPIYARDSHAGFQHLLLDYLLKVVNIKD